VLSQRHSEVIEDFRIARSRLESLTECCHSLLHAALLHQHQRSFFKAGLRRKLRDAAHTNEPCTVQQWGYSCTRHGDIPESGCAATLRFICYRDPALDHGVVEAVP